ncbi:MAG TPA: hypothetical protein VGK25_09335 [Ignavibacteria bacterium]|jgi:hypothetical protein
MKDSKLIEILKALSPKEFKDFGRFVRSPFFNRLNNVVKLYDKLKKYYPDFSSRNLTEENIHKTVLKEEFNYWKFKNLTSDLMRLAEEFLTHKRFNENVFEKKKYLLEELTAKQLDKAFEKNHREIEKNLETKKIKGEDYYYKKYQSEFLSGTYRFYKKDHSKENNLQEITDNFMSYSLIKILKLYTYMLNEEIVFKSGNKKLILINEIINHIKQFSYQDAPVIRIYFLVLMLTIEDNQEYYFELKKIKHNDMDFFDIDELYNINTCLRNFCTRMVLKGSKLFLKEYFELIQEEILDQLRDRHNFISHFRFMNAVITSLRLKEIGWAENFINENQNFLEPDYKHETVSLTTGMLHFARGKFEYALNELQKISFENCHHKMHLRNLTLQIYYELNYFEPALSVIDSYKHFLSREVTISGLYKDYNLNYVRYFAELLKIKMGTAEMEADELAYEIDKSPEFTYKEWLLEKLAELR